MAAAMAAENAAMVAEFEKRAEEARNVQQLALEIHEQKQQEKQAEKQEEQERLRLHKFNSKPAFLFRRRIIIVSTTQVILWYLLFTFLNTSIWEGIGLLILSLLLTFFIADKGLNSGLKGSNTRPHGWPIDRVGMAEKGEVPKRALIYLLSPVISAILCVIVILAIGKELLLWITIGAGLIVLFGLIGSSMD